MMNMDIVPNSRVTVTSADAVTGQADRVNKGKGGFNRRGVGSRNKRFDRMRDVKNAKVESDRFNDLINKYELDASTNACCAAILVGTSTSFPSATVGIKCENAIEPLVDATCTCLDSRKLMLPPTAKADMADVLRLQIRAKEIIARRGSGLARDEDYTAVGIERTVKHLFRAPHGIALYLSNIGKISYRGQYIYPKTDVPPPSSPNVQGMRRTELVHNDGRRLYVRLTQAARERFPPDHELTFVELAAPNVYTDSVYSHEAYDGMDELVSRYRILINMIERKFSYLVGEIDYQEAVGTTAQLVGSTLVRDETYTAHSTVPIVENCKN